MSDFGFFDLSADGVKLFDAAIDWAAADPPIGVGGSLGVVPEPGCGILGLIALLSGIGLSRRSSRKM
jgi:hypothetical protein